MPTYAQGCNSKEKSTNERKYDLQIIFKNVPKTKKVIYKLYFLK